ncbi:cell wall-binding repeat-containing protein [Clostridium kluyveri]|uniref:Cell wall-binding repeat 2 family protein n=1 Tax=Clostridium kluyveri TaxID=1534 RepID=A0A1L5FBW6_CLOKL|nr:cell wall-binding repeat-containing protein [Clostridium kluyveri]APM40310.1 cell wall-binding repeat 2 family protein [Clostridium kluyveri]
MIKRNKILSNIPLNIFIAFSVVILTTGGVSAASGRLWGQNRYETSAAVSKSGWTTSDYVILASGEGYADALCAAPIAKKYGAPILLTESGNLNQAVKEEITRLKARYIIEIGGTASISQSIEDQLKSMSLDVQRLGGQNRFETSVTVAKALGTIDKVVVTSGYGFADALSIAPIAASQNIPILLTGVDSLPDAVQGYIDENKDSIKDSYIIGGQGVISDSAISTLPQSVRISGQNRFETNVKVLDYFKGSIDFDNLYVVQADGPTGNEFADALSGSALAAKTSSPIILTYNSMYSGTESFIKSNVSKDAIITAIGGAAAVSESLVSSLQQIISQSDSQDPTNPSPGGGGSSSSDDYDTLSSALSKLKTVDTSGMNDTQKEIISDTITAVSKYLADTDYDYSEDAKNIKALYSSLSDSDRNDLQAAVVNSGISTSEVLILSSKFGL